VTDNDALPGVDASEQLKEKLLLPILLIITSSVPDEALDPAHAPEAEQEVALVELQVNVIELPISTSERLEVNDTVGTGGEDEPPPPQETIETKIKNDIE
jgi:hypothetical protein